MDGTLQPFALRAIAVGTLAVFSGAPRTAAHFRIGSLGVMQWACLGTSAAFWTPVQAQAGLVTVNLETHKNYTTTGWLILF